MENDSFRNKFELPELPDHWVAVKADGSQEVVKVWETLSTDREAHLAAGLCDHTYEMKDGREYWCMYPQAEHNVKGNPAWHKGYHRVDTDLAAEFGWYSKTKVDPKYSTVTRQS